MSSIETLPRIHKLPDIVANQIAAGEVIERPASVVKELIENSIDAVAYKIYIEIEQFGTGLIRVRDDGQGIHKDDLTLALQPHATSKLSSIADFEQIVSLGFRGEAIPSITSVSNFMLTSKLKGNHQAWMIDNQLNIKPAAHGTGTTVEVKDLFYSIPARRKFLKSNRTELLRIQSLIRAIALSYFSIGFVVKNEGQSLFSLPACKDDFEQRIKDVCGYAFLNKSITVDTEYDGMRLWGWLGSNDIARSQSDRQYFYVNGRCISDKHVNHAIRLAYKGYIDSGRFPSYVLHLQINPTLVDVNIHPAKSEVHFSDTRTVHDLIYSSLLGSLNKLMVYFKKDNDVNYPEIVLKQTENTYKVSDKFETEIKRQTDFFRDKNTASSEYIVLLSGKFLIANINYDQYLIDTIKARELLTEYYLYQHYQSNNITRRPVLVSVSCELNEPKLNIVLNHTEQTKRWGFELEQISPDRIMIRSIPARLAYADIIILVNDLLDALLDKKDEKIIAKWLARHVNDAGLNLLDDNTQELIKQIKSCEQILTKQANLPWCKLDQDTLSAILKK